MCLYDELTHGDRLPKGTRLSDEEHEIASRKRLEARGHKVADYDVCL